VLVQYLLAKDTADGEMWQLLADKLEVLGIANLSEERYAFWNNIFPLL
jgi:hypothetical protein